MSDSTPYPTLIHHDEYTIVTGGGTPTKITLTSEEAEILAMQLIGELSGGRTYQDVYEYVEATFSWTP